MSIIDDTKTILDAKNACLDACMKVIETFVEGCDDKTCDISSNPEYHWRGCPTKIKPLIENIKSIRNLD